MLPYQKDQDYGIFGQKYPETQDDP